MSKVLAIIIMVLAFTHVAPVTGVDNENKTIIITNDKKLNTKKTNNKEIYKKGWIKASCVCARKKPNKNARVAKELDYGVYIKFFKINKKWAKIKYKKRTYYVYSKYITKKRPRYTVKSAPSNNSIKSYMGYRAITSVSSPQYRLQHSKAYTGKYGIRQVNGRYCIALGSYYTKTVGKYVDVVLNNGKVIPCIIADCKADKDTDSMNRMHPDGSLVEFVVDTGCLHSTARRMGDISYCCKGWNSRVKKIKIYDKKERF